MDMIPWLIALLDVAVIAWTVGRVTAWAAGVQDGTDTEGRRWAASAKSGGLVRHDGKEYVVMSLPDYARWTQERHVGWVHLRSRN